MSLKHGISQYGHFLDTYAHSAKLTKGRANNVLS